MVELDDSFLLHYQAVDTPPTRDSYGLHPILSADARGLDSATAQILVSVLPRETEHDRAKQFREARRDHLELLSKATAVVAEHPDCLIVHNPRGNVSIAPNTFLEAVRDNLAPKRQPNLGLYRWAGPSRTPGSPGGHRIHGSHRSLLQAGQYRRPCSARRHRQRRRHPIFRARPAPTHRTKRALVCRRVLPCGHD